MFFKSLRPLWPYLKRYRWSYVAGTVCVLVNNAAWVLFPQIIHKAVDGLEHGVTRHALAMLAFKLLAVFAVRAVFMFLTRWILIGISRDVEFDMRNDLFARLETLSYSYYQRMRTGDIMARATNDLNAVRMLMGPALMYSANTIFLSVFALFFMLRISPYLTLVALAPMPLASILVQYLGRRIHERFERIQASFSDISAQAQENYSGVRLIRAFAREESQIGLFERLNQQYIGRALRLVQLMGMLWPTLEFILGISM